MKPSEKNTKRVILALNQVYNKFIQLEGKSTDEAEIVAYRCYYTNIHESKLYVEQMQKEIDRLNELLKEQQPRVLTYDEMKTMIGKPVYVEEPKRNADPHCCWGLVVEGEEPPKEGGYNYPGGVDFNVEVGLDAYDGDLYMVDIGCGWRAWTAEPTDEQRMNTPWEGR